MSTLTLDEFWKAKSTQKVWRDWRNICGRPATWRSNEPDTL